MEIKIIMYWILQNNLFNESGYDKLVETLDRYNINYSIHKVVPFIGELIPEPSIDTKNVICMGSYSLRHAAKKYGWNPGVFDLEPYNFNIQLDHWKDHMLNHDSVVTKFKDAKFDSLYKFVRPIEDSKVFAGKIFERNEFNTWQDSIVNQNMDFGYGENFSDTLIQLSSIKEIYSEHRFFIIKGNIVTASTYKIGSKVMYKEVHDQYIHNYVKDRIAEWQPLEAFVIDVALTSEGMKIVEINTLNSCGFYACDIQKLVIALEENF